MRLRFADQWDRLARQVDGEMLPRIWRPLTPEPLCGGSHRFTVRVSIVAGVDDEAGGYARPDGPQGPLAHERGVEMSTIDVATADGIRALHEDEVQAVNGAGVAPGCSLGTRLNISPFQWSTPLLNWDIPAGTASPSA
jgi:hypothetical protein